MQFAPSTCRENDRTLSKRPIMGPAKDVFALKINELLPIHIGWLAEYGIGNDDNRNNNIDVLKIEKNAYTRYGIIIIICSIDQYKP